MIDHTNWDKYPCFKGIYYRFYKDSWVLYSGNPIMANLAYYHEKYYRVDECLEHFIKHYK